MNNISMVEARLPPGFRFHPRDEELVCDYLLKKITHSDSNLMVEVDLNKCEPWDIPGEPSSSSLLLPYLSDPPVEFTCYVCVRVKNSMHLLLITLWI